MRRTHKLAIVAILAAGVFGPASAMAAALPPASYDMVFPGNQVMRPGTLTIGTTCLPDNTCYSGSASISYGAGAPNLALNLSVAPNSLASDTISAVARTSYYFTVSGPAEADVPLDISASASLSGDIPAASNEPGYVEENANLSVNGNFVNEACLYVNVGSCGSTPNAFSGVMPLGTFATGSLNQLQYRLVASINSNWMGTGWASETMDPDVFIDPNWLSDHPGYSLTFSPGGVPEPATWAMMIMGLGLIGFAARRRNQGVAVAA